MKEALAMPWYAIVALVCLVVGPFDALYLYIKSEKRKDAWKRREGREESADSGSNPEK